MGEAGDCEIEIFEEAEEEEVDSNGNDEEEFALVRRGGAEHSVAGEVTDGGGEGHEGAEFVVPCAVKDVAGDGEPDVAVLLGAKTPETEVDDGQEKKKK